MLGTSACRAEAHPRGYEPVDEGRAGEGEGGVFEYFLGLRLLPGCFLVDQHAVGVLFVVADSGLTPGVVRFN